MKKILLILLFLTSIGVGAQNEALANQYMEDGKFEKAVGLFEKLYNNNPSYFYYFRSLVECYQQLEKYNDADALIVSKMQHETFSPVLYVEQGYNYSLQNNEAKARECYDKAIAAIDTNPSYAFSVGSAFRDRILLEYSVAAYKKGMQANPALNFNYNLAMLYGEMNDLENMFSTYLDLLLHDEKYKSRILNNLGNFINEDGENEANQILRKQLLKRTQSDQDFIWNELLSWLFIQQKQYNSAFVQEKAIYKKTDQKSLGRIVNLARAAKEGNDPETSKEAYGYIIKNSPFKDLVLEAELNIITIDLELGNVKQNKEAVYQKFRQLIEEYGINVQTLQLQLAYARFLAFELNKPAEAQAELKQTMELPVNVFDQSRVKMTLADILVYNEQFNRALILYTQVQRNVKNDVMSQNARFKVAQASFYKGDFKWAESQLKVLKSSTSQLIANDALQLKLLISDNSLEDSTQTALKIYAKADLLAYQNKNTEAIHLLEDILINHKGEKIEDEALLKQAKLLEEEGDLKKAEQNYIKIINFFPNDILMDDALFDLAKLYQRRGEIEKAKTLYERVVLEHPDSIFYVEARNAYRKLRGDVIN